MPAPEYSLEADIERKDTIPPSDRTDARDEAAEVIEQMWPAHLKDIAEASEYSRQHIKNTLDTYFEVRQPAQSDRFELAVDVPEDVDRESFIRGYLKGHLDAED